MESKEVRADEATPKWRVSVNGKMSYSIIEDRGDSAGDFRFYPIAIAYDRKTADRIALIPELKKAIEEAYKELSFHNWQHSKAAMEIDSLLKQLND